MDLLLVMSQDSLKKVHNNDDSKLIWKSEIGYLFFSNSWNLLSFWLRNEERTEDLKSASQYNEQHLVILHPLYVPHLRFSLWQMLLLSINNVKWSSSKVLSGKLMILNAKFSFHICIPACSCWFNLKTTLQPPNAFLLKQVSCVNIMETKNQQKSESCHPGYSGKQCTGKYYLPTPTPRLFSWFNIALLCKRLRLLIPHIKNLTFLK